MTSVVVRAGRATEVVSAERRADLDELVASLRDCGYAVDLEVRDYEPGRRGISWAEAVWIYLAGQASTALAPKVMTDVYEAAKDWARRRYARKRAKPAEGKSRPESFVIYGPNGEVLKRWMISHDGERED